MVSYRRAALGILLAVALSAGQSAVAQQGTDDVAAKLQELRDAPPFNRADVRDDILALGTEAVGPLVQEVSKAATEKDKNFIAQCIWLLGELKDPSASGALSEALKNKNKQIAYFAARALGSIWEGKGSTDEQAKQVNAALLSIFCQKAPSSEAFAPGMALVAINGIPVSTADAVDAEKLQEGIDSWLEQADQSLPPRQDQPWPLLLRAVAKGRTPAVRQEAKGVLTASKPLEAVDGILALLRKEITDVPQSVWDALGEILSQITGVVFPPQTSEGNSSSRQELVDLWKTRWFETLPKRRAAEYRDYCWQKLEGHIQTMYMDPSHETVQEIEDYKQVLLAQLDGPQDIPEDASKAASKLLENALEVKEQISSALDKIAKAQEPVDRMPELRVIRDHAEKNIGREVGALFLDDFTAQARTETNLDNLALLADIMTLTSGIPCDLSQETDEERRQAIGEWLQIRLSPGARVVPTPE